ncbi:MAG: hypothetical protein II314_00070, partial [Prevotella sp.]|nr:hypothetical protein [Prevotella sp.]
MQNNIKDRRPLCTKKYAHRLTKKKIFEIYFIKLNLTEKTNEAGISQNPAASYDAPVRANAFCRNL